MYDFLVNNIVWWHWVVFGIILAVAEIIVPLFVIIWFGIGAIVIGIITFLFTLTFMMQFSSWLILSIIFLSIWFIFFKNKDIEKSGQADSRFDTRGVVVEPIKHGYRGRVHFDRPFLGSSDWVATSDEDINVGEHIKIEEVNGQLIKVRKDI